MSTKKTNSSSKILGKAVNDNPFVQRSAGDNQPSIRHRAQRTERRALSTNGAYAEPGIKVSIRSRKQR